MIKTLKIVVIQKNESKIKASKMNIQRKRLEIQGAKKRVQGTAVKNTQLKVFLKDKAVF